MKIGVVCGNQLWAQSLMGEFIRMNSDKVELFIVEDSFSKKALCKHIVSRYRRYGLAKLISQILLQFYLALKKPWSFVPFVPGIIDPIYVQSINSRESKKIVANNNIDVLVCLATSILDSEIIAIPKKYAINLHPGINPRYRGAGGNFWAIMEENWSLIGCTIHIMDEGIDTGTVIDRVYLRVSESLDSFERITYESIKKGLQHLSSILEVQESGSIQIAEDIVEETRCYGWYGLFEYLKMHRILSKKAMQF